MEITRPQVFYPPEGAEVELRFPPQYEEVRLSNIRGLKVTVEPIHKEVENIPGYETKPDTKDPNYTYKVLAQTLAANVHNDKLSDAAFRQFVTNCVREFTPPRDASMAGAHAEQFGAQKEVQETQNGGVK